MNEDKGLPRGRPFVVGGLSSVLCRGYVESDSDLGQQGWGLDNMERPASRLPRVVHRGAQSRIRV